MRSVAVAVAIAADGGVAAGPGVGEAAADHGARLAGCATAEQPVGMMSSAEFTISASSPNDSRTALSSGLAAQPSRREKIYGPIFTPHFALLPAILIYAHLFTRCPLHPHPRYSALVKLHRGKGPIEGGDFAFAEEGWVLKVEAGNILIYDPMELHGTTEMHLAGPDDGCIYIAFYVKKAIVGAAAGTMAMPAKAMAMK